MKIVMLNKHGLSRVLNGQVGMTFIADSFSDSELGEVAHVRDYRYKRVANPYCIWSIEPSGYEVIE